MPPPGSTAVLSPASDGAASGSSEPSSRTSGTAAVEARPQWGRRAELLEANSEMSVAELDGLIDVIGGYPSSRITTATVQVYDPATDR